MRRIARIPRAGALALVLATAACGPPAQVEPLCDAWPTGSSAARADAALALRHARGRTDEVAHSTRLCVSERVDELRVTVAYLCGEESHSVEAQPSSESWNSLERAHSLQSNLFHGLRFLTSNPLADLQAETDALVESCELASGP